MKDEKSQKATTKADNLQDPTANDTARTETTGTSKAFPNKANESKGAGSPYGGTQTANNTAPDGNQQINTGPDTSKSQKATPPKDLGDEYATKSSYGTKGSNKEGDNNGGDDARGCAIR
jgi:hypothetical protein